MNWLSLTERLSYQKLQPRHSNPKDIKALFTLQDQRFMTVATTY